MLTGLLDIKVSRLEQENDALLWARCVQLLWHRWFLDVSFLSKFSFLLLPAFLSEHLFRQPISFVGRWCALLASDSQKWDEQDRLLPFESKFSFSKGSLRWFIFHAIKNAAMDVKIPRGIRVATGLAGCLVLENKIVCLSIKLIKVVWASQVQSEM